MGRGPRAEGRPLRVLHGPLEIAGQVRTLVEGLRRLGHEADGIAYVADPYAWGGLAPVFPNGIPPPGEKQLALLRLMRRAASRYDVLHFHYGQTLFANNLDLAAWKAFGIPVVAHFWGDDVRLAAIAGRRNPWVREYVRAENDGPRRRRIRRFARWASVAIVGDHELLEYVGPAFPRVEVVPQAVDLAAYPPRPPDPDRARPVVAHVPSSTAAKGTRHVAAAVERLSRRIGFEFVLVTGKTHAEAAAALARADIVVDQLLLGAHGVLAVEAMALAKPVLSYVREDLRPTYPEGLPIVDATPDTIERELEALLRDGARRRELGLRGRAYAERNHDAVRVARRLVDVYESLLA